MLVVYRSTRSRGRASGATSPEQQTDEDGVCVAKDHAGDFFPQDWAVDFTPKLDPVKEEQTWDVIRSLPENSWLRQFCSYASKMTTAPVVYHLGVGAVVLGSTCPSDYGVDYGPWTIRPNIYTLLVGRSGKDRKSSALKAGSRLLRYADMELIGSEPGSWEGFLDSLQESPRQTLFYSEFGKLLSTTQQGYLAPLKELFTDLWDCQSQTRRTKKDNIVIRDPRLSIGAAVSIPYLEKYTLAEDWHGGFMGRWMVMYGSQERDNPFPPRSHRAQSRLTKLLENRLSIESAGWCRGLDPAARRMWDLWYNHNKKRILPSNIGGVETRVPTIALKLCLVLGWDYGPATEKKPWLITEDILNPAIQIAELHLSSVVGLSNIIAEHEDARLRRSIIKAIKAEGGAATIGQILLRLKMRRRIVDEMLGAMIEMGDIQHCRTLKGQTYRTTR